MTTSNPAPSPARFPLMKLPPEIRLMIYDFAVHGNTAAATSGGSGLYATFTMPHPYLGALALIHTTSIIREENRDAMHAIAYRQWKVLYRADQEDTQDWRTFFELVRVADVWEALKIDGAKLLPFKKPGVNSDQKSRHSRQFERTALRHCTLQDMAWEGDAGDFL